MDNGRIKWRCPGCGKLFSVRRELCPELCPACEDRVPDDEPGEGEGESQQFILPDVEPTRTFRPARRPALSVAWAVFGVLLLGLVGLLVVHNSGVKMGDLVLSFISVVALIVIVVVAALLYFVPTIVAFARKHANVGPIAVINVFLGWTLVGYAVALAWAFMSQQQQRHIHYHVKDDRFET